jgi:uncharacterized glyoxalase superfamily protein PhnB
MAEKLQPRCFDIVPELSVANLQGALAWFNNVLGFRTAWVWQDNFACVVSGDVQIYLRKVDTPIGVARCYLHVASADTVYSRCQQQQATIVDPLASQPWGMREFAVETPGGHVLRIGHGEKEVKDISDFKKGDAAC